MKQKIKKGVTTLAVVLSLVGMSNAAWASTLTVYASKIVQVFLADIGAPSVETLFVIRHGDTTQAVPASNPSYCYNQNDATYELRLERSHPYYKELMAVALVSHVANKPVAVTTRDESCSIQTMGLTPSSVN